MLILDLHLIDDNFTIIIYYMIISLQKKKQNKKNIQDKVED